MAPRLLFSLSVAFASIALPAGAAGADEDLASYFGFDGLEVIKVGPNAGPFIVADLNADGLNDLIAVNNSKSRIEVHYQRAGASPSDEVEAPTHVNELPEHWRFRREYISVGHAISGLVAIDLDKDGLVDLVYAGQPGTIGFLRQTKPGVFELDRKVPVKGLAANRDAFAVADVIGDEGPDVIAIAGGRLKVWPLDGTSLGAETELSVGADALVAFLLGDYDGDGTTDIAGVVPDSPTPVRIWRGVEYGGTKGLGSQVRFEMPPLREAATLVLPGKDANALAVIEKPTRRVVVGELRPEPVSIGGVREAPLTVWGFADSGNRKRSVAVVDVNGDGMLDVLATNTQDNALSLWQQRIGHGLQPPVTFPAFSDLDAVVAQDVDGDTLADIFLVSEKEGVVGRTRFAESAIAFPQAMTIAPGHVPVVESLVALDEGTRLAVVAKEGRNYLLELLPLDRTGSTDQPRVSVPLGALAKQPDAILALDADRDGKRDLLLFTADKPLIMLRASDADGKRAYTAVESKDMGQFGLVQAAQSENTGIHDIDGDGMPELLVADKNFVRALRYVSPDEAAKTPGSSPGWQVVRQLNAARGDAKLVSLAVMPAEGGAPARIVAADRENSMILLFTQGSGGEWSQTDSLVVSGFKFNGVRAGSFSGDGKPDVLVIGDDGFAIARLDGERLEFAEIAAWSPDSTRRVHHELVSGDVNGDGHLDVVALDAGEQFADVLTFTATNRLLHALAFNVFETRMFSSGEPREFEPSMGVISDVTGDGADDLVLLCHDRVLLYPQTRAADRGGNPKAGSASGGAGRTSG